MRWYRGSGDRKPLCNLVRLEIEAAIGPTGPDQNGLDLSAAAAQLYLQCIPRFHLGVHTEHIPLCMKGRLMDSCKQWKSWEPHI